MKLEPLKNKKCIADGILSATTFQLRTESDFEKVKKILNEKYFEEEDIKSAVEWLKKTIKENWHLKSYQEFVKTIDKAFEDVNDRQKKDSKI